MKGASRQKRGKQLGRIQKALKVAKKLKERKDRGRAPENK
jgi:hypothetical protein